MNVSENSSPMEVVGNLFADMLIVMLDTVTIPIVFVRDHWFKALFSVIVCFSFVVLITCSSAHAFSMQTENIRAEAGDRVLFVEAGESNFAVEKPENAHELLVTGTPDGSVTATAVVSRDDTTVTWPVVVEGGTLINPVGVWEVDGGYLFLQEPVAYDEHGTEIPTHYEICSETSIVQVFDGSSAKSDLVYVDPSLQFTTRLNIYGMAWWSDTILVTQNSDFKIHLYYYDANAGTLTDSSAYAIGSTNNGPPQRSVSTCGDTAYVTSRRTGTPGTGYFNQINLNNLSQQTTSASWTDETPWNVSECVSARNRMYVCAGVETSSGGSILSISDTQTVNFVIDDGGIPYTHSLIGGTADDSGAFYFDVKASSATNQDLRWKPDFVSTTYTQVDILYVDLSQDTTGIRDITNIDFGSDSGNWICVLYTWGATFFKSPPDWTSNNRSNVEHFHVVNPAYAGRYSGNTYLTGLMGVPIKATQISEDSIAILCDDTGAKNGSVLIFDVRNHSLTKYDTSFGICGAQGDPYDMAYREVSGGTIVLTVASAGGYLDVITFAPHVESSVDTVSFTGPFTLTMNEDSVGETTLVAVTSTGGSGYSFNVLNGSFDYCSATIAGTSVLQCTVTNNLYGEDTVLVQVTFGTSTDSGIVTVTINGVDDSPSFTSYEIGPFSVDEDTPQTTFSLKTYALDQDGDTSSLVWLSLNESVDTSPFDWSVEDSTVVIEVKANENGMDTIHLRLSSTNGYFADTILHVTVNPTNDSPTLGAIPNISMDTNATYSLVLTSYVSHADDSAVTWVLTNDSGHAWFDAELTADFVDPYTYYTLVVTSGDTSVAGGEITLSAGDGDEGDTVSILVIVSISSPAQNAVVSRKVIGSYRITPIRIETNHVRGVIP